MTKERLHSWVPWQKPVQHMVTGLRWTQQAYGLGKALPRKSPTGGCLLRAGCVSRSPALIKALKLGLFCSYHWGAQSIKQVWCLNYRCLSAACCFQVRSSHVLLHMLNKPTCFKKSLHLHTALITAVSPKVASELHAFQNSWKCRVHPNASQWARSDACRAQIRQTRPKRGWFPPHQFQDIAQFCNQLQPLSDCYTKGHEDSKEVKLESSSVNNSSLGTTDNHVTLQGCILEHNCLQRNCWGAGGLLWMKLWYTQDPNESKIISCVWLEDSVCDLKYVVVPCRGDVREKKHTKRTCMVLRFTKKRSSCIVYQITELQNNSGWILPEQGHLEPVVRDCIKMSFEYLQGWRLRNISDALQDLWLQ